MEKNCLYKKVNHYEQKRFCFVFIQTEDSFLLKYHCNCCIFNVRLSFA